MKIKFFFIVVTSLLLIFSMLSGCYSHYRVTSTILKEKPKPTATSLTQTLNCVCRQIKKTISDTAYIIVVDDFVDGTVRPESYNDGIMADAGRNQFCNIIFESLPIHSAIVLNRVPPLFGNTSGSKTGLNEYGVIPDKKWIEFSQYYLREINLRRRALNLPKATSTIVFRIEGIFSAFDDDNYKSLGYGTSAGNNGSDAEGEVNFGRKKENRSITLITNIINPHNNCIMASKSLTITSYKTGYEANFKIMGTSGSEAFFAFSNEEMVTESIHAAQLSLIHATSLWVLSEIFPADSIKPCLEKDKDFSRIISGLYEDTEEKK